MGKLVGLEGVQRDIDCLYIWNGSDIHPILKNEYAATAAGANGAINIWYDDDRKIRCEAMAHFRQIDYKEFDTLEEAEKWADFWLVYLGVRP